MIRFESIDGLERGTHIGLVIAFRMRDVAIRVEGRYLDADWSRSEYSDTTAVSTLAGFG